MDFGCNSQASRRRVGFEDVIRVCRVDASDLYQNTAVVSTRRICFRHSYPLKNTSRAQGGPGEPRRAQESPGEPRRAQESPRELRRAQESPGEPRSARESLGDQCFMIVGRAQESHAILSICRMLILLSKCRESALRLYSGCNSVKMQDVTFVQKSTESALCPYAGCNVVYICRISLLFDNAVKVHCVYMPDVILCICRITFLL